MFIVILLLYLIGGLGLPIIAAAENLDTLLQNTPPGAVLTLPPGLYPAHLIIDKPLTLQGTQTVLDGGGKGDALRIRAPGVTVRGLTIQNSGLNLTEMNAGIFVEKTAAAVLIEDNFLKNNAFGVWLDSCPNAVVRHNRIVGDPSLRSQDQGNGIHLFNTKQANIDGNEIWQVRDGIYIEASENNTLQNNILHDLRYGIHYMYAHHNQIIGNHTFNTRTGYALMQSQYLTVKNNVSENDQNYGILLNYITYSELTGNRIANVQRGRNPIGDTGSIIQGAEGKALFVYNSLFNQISGNVFAHSEIGIHLTAGSEQNAIFNNDFINNYSQVKYVATHPQEWSYNNRGNFWSDYLGWDRNADGVGDVAYEPNDAVDKLLWRYPAVRLLMHSPAIETLRWVQREFPVFRPQGVRDSFPLMRPFSEKIPAHRKKTSNVGQNK